MTDDIERPENPRSHADTAFDASLARAQLGVARAGLCGHGIRREACGGCRGSEGEGAGDE